MKERKAINLEVGRRIREKREELKLSRECLAERAEISPRFVADIERGIVGPSLTTLKRICETLCISSDSILWGDKAVTAVSQKAAYIPTKYDALFADILQRMIDLTYLAESRTDD